MLQRRLKRSLTRTWKHALTLDWISPDIAKSLPLLEYYVGLRWTKLVKALTNYTEEMTSIMDVFKVIDKDEELEPFNIYIEGNLIELKSEYLRKKHKILMQNER